MNSIFQKRSCLTEREVKQYLSDELSDEQRYDVENHLLDCELCSAAVEGYARTQDFDPVEEDIQILKSRVTALAPGIPQRRLAWINRAAAVALILILAYAGFLYWNASLPKRLFTAYFEPVADIVYRSPDGEAPPLPRELKQALEDYNAEAFASSLPHFANYLENNPEDYRATLLAANAHLQAGQAAQAEQYLLQLKTQGESFQGQVAWYLALAYLRQGKMPQARAKLERIQADTASPFQKKAKLLLERMK